MSSRYDTEFEEVKKIGKGGYGTVFLCKNILDKKLYAIKKVPIKDVLDGHRERVLREVYALSTMDHPHVVRYFQAWIEDGCNVESSTSEEECSSEASVKANATLHLQMNYCPETLKDVLDSSRVSEVLDKKTITRYMRQLADGVHHIHAQHYVHRDLSRGNVFLDEKNNIRIGDLGLALFLEDLSAGRIVSEDAGNELYLAPELKKKDDKAALVNNMIVTEKADIFSIGLVYCDLLCQFVTGRERIEAFDQVRRGIFPTELIPTLHNLFALNPSDRPTALELKSQLPEENIEHGAEDLGYGAEDA